MLVLLYEKTRNRFVLMADFVVFLYACVQCKFYVHFVFSKWCLEVTFKCQKAMLLVESHHELRKRASILRRRFKQQHHLLSADGSVSEIGLTMGFVPKEIRYLCHKHYCAKECCLCSIKRGFRITYACRIWWPMTRSLHFCFVNIMIGEEAKIFKVSFMAINNARYMRR